MSTGADLLLSPLAHHTLLSLVAERPRSLATHPHLQRPICSHSRTCPGKVCDCGSLGLLLRRRECVIDGGIWCP